MQRPGGEKDHGETGGNSLWQKEEGRGKQGGLMLKRWAGAGQAEKLYFVLKVERASEGAVLLCWVGFGSY